VLAPYDGVLSEYRVRVGQAIQAGQVLSAVVPPDSRAYVVAALPGNDHARLRAGQVMHLELEGHRRVSIDVTLDSVSVGVLGAAEVRELLGAASESMQVPGAVTLVTAPLASTTFQDRDATYVLSHGMLTRASVEVSTDTLLDLLLPDVRRM
jgi:multidrug efflux pump subunit AcrA (membrane-fusion protein)